MILTYLKKLLTLLMTILMSIIPLYAQGATKIHWGTTPTYANTPDEVLPDPEQSLPLNDNTQPLKHYNTIPQEASSLYPKDDITIEEQQLNQDVRLLWDEINQMEQRQNDIKILPIKPVNPNIEKHNTISKSKENKSNKMPATSIKAEKQRIDTLLRNTKNKDKNNKNKNDKNSQDKSNKKIPAPIVTLPQLTTQPKPVLTRKQVLEQEIKREKAALKSARAQFKIAQKRGNSALAEKLIKIIKDRELNVEAISREISR